MMNYDNTGLKDMKNLELWTMKVWTQI